MSRSARGITLALLALGLPLSMLANQSGNSVLIANTFLNLDTGAKSASGADILWDGVALTPQGRAVLFNAGKYGLRGFKAIRSRHASSATYRTTPIPASALVVGDVFGVRTNAGHYAKVIVTESSAGSLSIQYTTFGAATLTPLATGPVITKVQNNYSYILPGLPNYGIAPGSLFVIFGTGLSTTDPPVLQSSAAPGLPTTLNQTSVSVTVNGVTTTPALYYATATAVAAVLPSKTPVGNGTLTVTYNGQTSAAAPIRVTASAFGLDTLYGTGNGSGVVTDVNGNVLGLTNSAMPGQAVVLWGSGIGADTSSDDRTYPQNTNNLTTIPTQVFVGGISANVLYRGRSQYPGLDQIDVTIPANAPTGCFVSVSVATGVVASNSVTIPVSPNGGPCSDPATGLSGTQLQALANKSSVNSVAATLAQSVDENGKNNFGAIVIAVGLGGANFGKGYEYASQGSCTIVPPEQGGIENFFQNGLDAGTVSISTPGGQFNMPSQGPGFYQNQLSGSLVPGAYSFSASGGANIGKFQASFNVQTPLTLTNKAAIASMDRTQDATVTWTGGFPNGDVQVEGAVGNQYGSTRFFCHAPSSAGQLTIPSSILQAMSTGGGSLVITNISAGQPITASGVDVGFAAAQVEYKLTTVFK